MQLTSDLGAELAVGRVDAAGHAPHYSPHFFLPNPPPLSQQERVRDSDREGEGEIDREMGIYRASEGETERGMGRDRAGERGRKRGP